MTSKDLQYWRLLICPRAQPLVLLSILTTLVIWSILLILNTIHMLMTRLVHSFFSIVVIFNRHFAPSVYDECLVFCCRSTPAIPFFFRWVPPLSFSTFRSENLEVIFGASFPLSPISNPLGNPVGSALSVYPEFDYC